MMVTINVWYTIAMPRIHKRNCDYCKAFYKGVGFKYCSKKCSEVCMVKEKSPSWKGGKQIDKSGYILIMNKEHPKARKGYVREHRIVMEDSIGRYLKDDEIVHHINGDKSDNRLSNLEIMTLSNHAVLHHTKHTDDELVKKILDLKKILGRNPTSRDANNSIFIHRFGTFNKALEFAGLKPNRKSSKI
jgi:hypothetical protein